MMMIMIIIIIIDYIFIILILLHTVTVIHSLDEEVCHLDRPKKRRATQTESAISFKPNLCKVYTKIILCKGSS